MDINGKTPDIRMRKRSITRRWAINNLGVVLLILLTAELAIVYFAQYYYYNSAKQHLISKMNSIISALSRSAEDPGTNFSAEIRSTLENFTDKDRMELMAINSRGQVTLTSSGFTPGDTVTMPDYTLAMEGGQRSYGYYAGSLSSGERVMAVTYPITTLSNEYSAIRVIISLEEIDQTIITITIIVSVICIVIFLMLSSSGLYFIRSIVQPVREIGATAEKYAKGDFSVRITNHTGDEIGDLCVAINHMADELSSAETMKNEFISSVSHELRTPLTAIKGWAETIALEDDPETIKKGIRVINGETARLSQMVEELLDFSRMQSGHFSLQFDRMDVLAELEDAVLIYAERAKQENITLIYDEPEQLPIIFGDKNRIRQVFINIIDNAIKYSNPGGTVTVTADEHQGWARIIVRDRGCGIKSTDLPKIKTKFYKANHTRRGSGIGLGVADEIVELHGGTLTIESEIGVGTAVTILLPPKREKNK